MTGGDGPPRRARAVGRWRRKLRLAGIVTSPSVGLGGGQAAASLFGLVGGSATAGRASLQLHVVRVNPLVRTFSRDIARAVSPLASGPTTRCAYPRRVSRSSP